MQKSQFYSVFPAQKDAFSTHSAIDKDAHARKRRVISHAFSESAIKTMEKYILAHVRTFCDRLGERGVVKREGSEQSSWSNPQNVSNWCDYITFDILGDLCFGKAFDMLERPDNRFAVELIGNAAQRHLICGCFPMLHELHLDKVLFHKIAAGRSRYMKYSKSQAVERTKLGMDVDRKDFFYYLLNAKDPETGKGFSMSELWGESNLLLIAGSDTTSTSLASTFFYLVHSGPSVLEKLKNEITAAFGGIENLEEIRSGPKLNACVYLRACVDEAMRLSPPVGGLLPREVLSGGLEIDGHQIPAGTVVGTPTYAIHHNQAYFPNPFEYVPERWISNSESAASQTSADAITLAKSAFCPFSIGPRGCIGKNLAYTELLITVARTVCLYDMRVAQGQKTGGGSQDGEIGRRRPGEFQLWDTFTSNKADFFVEFSPCRSGNL